MAPTTPRCSLAEPAAGSGVAASLGLSLAAVGAAGNAGLITPAGYNNVVAIHPTIGLVSRDLVLTTFGQCGTVGPLTRTVKDAAYLLQAMAGVDSNDNYTSAIPWASGASAPDYVAACSKDALHGKRIGVIRNTFKELGTEPGGVIYKAFNEALDTLREAGAEIVDNTNYTAYDQWSNYTSAPFVFTGFRTAFEKYTSQLTTNPNKHPLDWRCSELHAELPARGLS